MKVQGSEDCFEVLTQSESSGWQHLQSSSKDCAETEIQEEASGKDSRIG